MGIWSELLNQLPSELALQTSALPHAAPCGISRQQEAENALLAHKEANDICSGKDKNGKCSMPRAAIAAAKHCSRASRNSASSRAARSSSCSHVQIIICHSVSLLLNTPICDTRSAFVTQAQQGVVKGQVKKPCQILYSLQRRCLVQH